MCEEIKGRGKMKKLMVKKGISAARFLQKFKDPMWLVGIFLLLGVGSLLSVLYTYSKTTLLDDIYYTIGLFAISGSNRPDFLSHFGVASFAFMDAGFLVLTIVVLIAENGMRSAIGFALPKQGHTIVLGAGHWGLHYANALVARGKDVILIDMNPSDEAFEEVLEQRCNSKSGDGHLFLVKGHFTDSPDDKLLRKVAAHSAKKIMMMLDNDGANIDAAYAMRPKLEKFEKKGFYPTIMLPVDDIRLSTSLAVYKRFTEYAGEVEIRFFNIMQQAAVRHLMQHPPELYADIFGQKQIHFAIYGLGNVAINLIYVIGHLCHYRTWDIDNGKARDAVKKVRVTILDQDIDTAKQEIYCLFPNIEQVLDIEFVSSTVMNGFAPHDYFLPLTSKMKADKSVIPPVTQHFFCFKDETLSVRCAVKLRRQQMKLSGVNTPIFVRSQDGEGLARLIESNCGKPEWPDNIFSYVILSDKLDGDIYFSEHIEKIAKVFNAGDPEGSNKDKYDELWGYIPSDFKHSSFFQAAYLRIRLRSVGYDWVVAKNNMSAMTEAWLNDSSGLNAHLALLEHQRYKGERWMLGWDKDIRTQGDIARTHDQLEVISSNKNWDDAYDIKQVEQLNSYLRNAGCGIEKVRVIGVIQANSELIINKNEHIIFNLLDVNSRAEIKQLLKTNKNYSKQITGLLPLPIEVIKGILPLFWSVNESTEYNKYFNKKNGLLNDIKSKEIENEDAWTRSVIEDVSRLSGMIGMYIEMPLEYPFHQWKRGDQNLPVWLGETCEVTDAYIRCRADKVIGAELSENKVDVTSWSSRFIPKPSLKEKAHAQGE